MKIIFAGTPTFAAHALEALVDAGHEIALVLTQPDRPAGRGMKAAASAVKLLTQQRGLALLQPPTLKSPELQVQLVAIGAEVMVVAAYGLILPPEVLTLPRYGCLNIHASLLPRWRGAAPIQRAILAGDQQTGITIMQMDQGLDTGAILLQQSTPIAPDDTAQTLHDKLAALGGRCMVETLMLLQQGKLAANPQDETAASYAAKLKKTEAEIDWRLSAEQINRAVRAFNPQPGAYTTLRGKLLKIWQARPGAKPVGKVGAGEIVALERAGIAVACGNGNDQGGGTLVLEVVQQAGGKKLGAAEFLAGHALQAGDRFENKHD